MAEFIESLLRRLRRSRLALVCLGFLGLLSGAASITLLVVVLRRAVGSSPSPTWYSYAGVVVQTLAVAVPALACVVVATRGWTRGSDLLRGDDADAGFKDSQGTQPLLSRFPDCPRLRRPWRQHRSAPFHRGVACPRVMSGFNGHRAEWMSGLAVRRRVEGGGQRPGLG